MSADNETISVDEFLTKMDAMESEPKVEFDDWYKFPNDEFCDMPAPAVPYPNSTFYHTLEEWLIRYYTEFKWAVLPCRLDYDSRGKKLIAFEKDGWSKSVPQMEHQIAILREFSKRSYCRSPANGLVLLCGKISNVLMADFDQPVEEAWKFVRNAGIQIFNDSMTSLTQSGGNQIPFEWDPVLDDVATTRAKFFGPSSPFDIRGNNGLAILPPSRIYDPTNGVYKQYRWDDQVKNPKIYPIPTALKDILLKRHEDRKENLTKNLPMLTKSYDKLSPAQVRMLKNELDKCMNAKLGARSERYYSYACLCVKVGLSVEAITESMKDLEKCKEKGPEYTKTVITAAARSVDVKPYKYASAKPSSVPPGKVEPIANVLERIMERRKNRPPQQWIVPGLFAEGQVSIFFAKPGLGKTIVLTETAIRLSNGQDLFGGIFSHEKHSKVLVIHYDLTETTYTDQYVRRMRDSDNLSYIVRSEIEAEGGSINLDNDVGRNTIEELLKTYEPEWVLIDTISAAVTIDQNKEESVTPLMLFLKKISSAYGTHICCVHHPRKKGNLKQGERQEYVQDDLAGSNAWSKFADFTVVFNPVYDSEGAEIKRTGQFKFAKIGSLGSSILDNVVFSIGETLHDDGTSDLDIKYKGTLDEKISGLERRILYTIYAAHRKKRKDIIAAVKPNVNVCVSTIDKTIKKMIEEGLIFSSGYTVTQEYNLTERGIDMYENKKVEKDQPILEGIGIEEEKERVIIDYAVLSNFMYKEDARRVCPSLLVSRSKLVGSLKEKGYEDDEINGSIDSMLKQRILSLHNNLLFLTDDGKASIVKDFSDIVDYLNPTPKTENSLAPLLAFYIDGITWRKVEKSPITDEILLPYVETGMIVEVEGNYEISVAGKNFVTHNM